MSKEINEKVYTSLKSFIKNNDLTMLKKFIVSREINGEYFKIRNCYYLNLIAYYGHYEMFKFIFFSYFNIYRVDNWAFQWACLQGHMDIVKFFYVYGIDSYEIKKYNCYAFRKACEKGHYEIVEFMLEKKFLTTNDIKACDNYALRWVIMNGHYSILELLLEYGITFQDVRSVLKWADESHFFKRHMDLVICTTLDLIVNKNVLKEQNRYGFYKIIKFIIDNYIVSSF